MSEPAERFLKHLSEARIRWRSIDVRTVAVRIGRRWTQLATRGYLDHRPPRTVGRLLPVVRSRLMAWQFVRPIKDVEAVVNGWVAGCIKLRPRFIWVLDGKDPSRHDLHYSFNDLSAPHRVARYDQWSGHSLIGYGPQVWDLVQMAGLDPQDLDNIIRAGPNAYDGYAGLIRFFHGRPEPLTTHSSSSVFELIAPLAVRFDVERTSSSRDGITLGLRARSRDYTHSSELHWTSVGTGALPRHGSVKLRDCRWRSSGAHTVSTVQIPLKDGDLVINAFLQDQQRCLDRLTLPTRSGLVNRRIAAHASSDPELARFKRDLFPVDWSRAREFEQAVGVLFHFFGFQIDPLYSQSGASAALDHVAHDPLSDAVIGVECTVGALETGKLGKLVARAQALREVVEKGAVLPVLVCARPIAELSTTELAKADTDGVIVLAREDLQDLWIAAERGASSSDLVADLRQRLAEVAQRRARAAST